MHLGAQGCIVRRLGGVRDQFPTHGLTAWMRLRGENCLECERGKGGVGRPSPMFGVRGEYDTRKQETEPVRRQKEEQRLVTLEVQHEVCRRQL